IGRTLKGNSRGTGRRRDPQPHRSRGGAHLSRAGRKPRLVAALVESLLPSLPCQEATATDKAYRPSSTRTISIPGSTPTGSCRHWLRVPHCLSDLLRQRPPPHDSRSSECQPMEWLGSRSLVYTTLRTTATYVCRNASCESAHTTTCG